ncbi:MAG: helix-turn-helix domain-containing protein [Eubacteriales bacterium]
MRRCTGVFGRVDDPGLAESVYGEGICGRCSRRFGVSPKRYLTSVRVSAAKQLLVQTDMTVERVSREVGMPDALYFSRVFRDVTGVSPTEYRRRFYEE